jgi:hypothetical protein
MEKLPSKDSGAARASGRPLLRPRDVAVDRTPGKRVSQLT